MCVKGLHFETVLLNQFWCYETEMIFNTDKICECSLGSMLLYKKSANEEKQQAYSLHLKTIDESSKNTISS